MEINPNFLSPCGLYCGVCGVYYATRDNNDKFLQRLLDMYAEKIPGLENLTIDDLRCDGCLSNNPSFFCSACSIKDCTREKGYTGCHECEEFPCNYIDNFPMPVGKKVIMRAIPTWSELGTREWVIAEEARYVCPECSHKIFRGAKRCNKCKNSLDLD